VHFTDLNGSEFVRTQAQEKEWLAEKEVELCDAVSRTKDIIDRGIIYI